MLLNSFEYDAQEAVAESKRRAMEGAAFVKRHAAKFQAGMMAAFGAAAGLLYSCPALAASVTDVKGGTNQIVDKIATLINDFYNDFVFLSLGVLAAVVVYHLIRIMLAAGDDRERSLHTRAIVTAIIAFFVINVFMFIIGKLLDITGGRNTGASSDLFSTSSDLGHYK